MRKPILCALIARNNTVESSYRVSKNALLMEKLVISRRIVLNSRRAMHQFHPN